MKGYFWHTNKERYANREEIIKCLQMIYPEVNENNFDKIYYFHKNSWIKITNLIKN